MPIRNVRMAHVSAGSVRGTPVTVDNAEDVVIRP